MIGRAAVIAIVALALSGCAGGNDGGDPVATDAIAMARSYRFAPVVATVSAGTTVTWMNEDNFTHNVRIGDDIVGEAAPGGSVTHEFAQPGTYKYDCSLHPNDMTGEVVVTE